MSIADATTPEASPTFGKLFAALSKAQAKLEAAAKDKKNPHFNSRYADLASIWDACRLPLGDNELCVVQQPIFDAGRVGLRTTLGHASGEWLASTVWTTPKDTGPQALGSCLTYLRRYALAAMVGVAPDDDDGNAADGRGADPRGNRAPASAQTSAPDNPAGAGNAERPARANTVVHDGKKASADQVRLLQVLRGKLQIPDCDGPEKCADKYQEWSKSSNGPVDKVRYCTYHQQLQAFKDQKGLPIRSSKDLSVAQISNLIDRYQAKLSTQASRADGRSQQAAEDLAQLLSDNGTDQVLAAIKNTGTSDTEVAEYILAPFGADAVGELNKDDKPKALALILALAKGTEAYIDVMDRLGFPTAHLR